MIRWMQSRVLRLMKVPDEPHPPEGATGSIRIFRSGRNYYRWRLIVWLFASFGSLIMVAILMIPLSVAIRRAPPLGRFVAETVAVMLVAGYLASLLFTFLQQRLNFELRWYVVTDRCLRIRSGI